MFDPYDPPLLLPPSDGYYEPEVTMQFDDAEVDRKGAVERVLNRGRPQAQGSILGR
jgi:hypothetical protein